MKLLRPLRDEDFAPLAEMVAEPSVARFWHGYDERKLRDEAAEAWVTGFAIESEGRLAGLLFLSEEEEDPDYRHADVDIFLSPDFQGRGLGAEAIREALRIAFEERGHHRAVIYTDVDNVAGRRCYEKVGYRRVGILRQADRTPDGEWRDLIMFDILAGELRTR